MKLIFENWKRFLKEARDARGIPVLDRTLFDVPSYSGNVTHRNIDTDNERRSNERSTPGYKASEKFLKSVKSRMDKTPQDWMFVTAKNYGTVSSLVASQSDKKAFQDWLVDWIQKWLREHNKPENFLDNTIFLIIASPKLKNDFGDLPEWFIHDVLGHSIYYAYEKTPAKYKKPLDPDFINYVQKEIKGPATADFDRLVDVFAEIILGNLSQEQMKKYGENYLKQFPNQESNVNSTITEIFDYTDWWINRYLKRGPDPKNWNYVELWNSYDPDDR